MLRPSLLLPPLVLLLVGACASGHDVAEKGRRVVVGMDVNSLQACAGIPTRTKRLDAQTELYSYEIHYENTGGAQITLPIVGGGFKAGATGSDCYAIVRGPRGQGVDGGYHGGNADMNRRERVVWPRLR